MMIMMAKGVSIEACAIYLPGQGADESVLTEGVGIAQTPAMAGGRWQVAGAMLEADARVWSF